MPPSQSPSDRSAERSSAADAYDPGIVADLEACFGRTRLRDLLGGLRAELAVRFVAPPVERDTLAHDAHVLVSASGMLGFLDLSRACAELGRACRDGVDLRAALDLAGQAARRAREAIDGMLAEPA